MSELMLYRVRHRGLCNFLMSNTFNRDSALRHFFNDMLKYAKKMAPAVNSVSGFSITAERDEKIELLTTGRRWICEFPQVWSSDERVSNCS
jgi:hypothetical protein